MSAGLNVFFTIVMVLSDTDAVRSVVTTVRGEGVVTTGKGVPVAVVGVSDGGTAGDSEHPVVRRSMRAMTRSTGTDLIVAGRSFPYNKVMA
jgi:hypothetical protein